MPETRTRTAVPFLPFLFVVIAVPGPDALAQEPGPAELRERFEQKLAEPFVAKVDWATELDAAKRLANESGRPIFAYFTRSYAPCAPCRAVEKGVLEGAEFATFAKEEVVPFLHVTTRIPGRADDDLLERYGQSGFPSLLVLDAEGRCVAIPDERTIEAFRAAVRRARERAVEARDADLRGPREAAEAWLRDRRLGNYADPDADRAAFVRHRAELTPEELAAVERSLAGRMLTSAVRRLEDLGLTEGRLDFAAPAVEAALFRVLAAREALDGWPPGAPSNRALITLLAWADAQDDPKLFTVWLDQLRVAREGLAGNEEILDFFTARLASLEQGEEREPLLEAFFSRRVDHR